MIEYSLFYQWMWLLHCLIIYTSEKENKQLLCQALSDYLKQELITWINIKIDKRNFLVNISYRFSNFVCIYPVRHNNLNDVSSKRVSYLSSVTNMRSQWSRLSTFSTFPNNDQVSLLRLAEAGFYYEGNVDEVVCYACHSRHRNWTSSDHPREVHLRIAPNCPHYQDGSQNIPLTNFAEEQGEENSILNAVSDNVDVIPSSDDTYLVVPEIGSTHDTVGAETEYEEKNVNQTQNGNRQQVSTNISFEYYFEEWMSIYSPYITASISTQPLRIMRFPDYVTIDERRRSFENIQWTRLGRLQSPQQMAEAGLFYTGSLDRVRCFHCGIGLYEWENADDPFVEHARWSPTCAFMKIIKGNTFIKTVQEIAPENPSELRLNELNLQQREQTQSPTPLHPSWKEEKAALSKIIDDLKKEKENSENAKKELEKENDELKRKQLCKVCLSDSVNIAFLPCGHLACCSSCARRLEKCPVCRATIKGTVRTYLP